MIVAAEVQKTTAEQTMPQKKTATLNSKQLMTLLKLGSRGKALHGAGVGKAKLMEMLQTLPPVAKGDSAGLLARLERYYPEPALSFDECLILSFVDDCIGEILKQASLDPDLEWLIFRFAPHVALVAVAKGPAKLFDSSPAFGMIDQLCEYCIGWSRDLGILGELTVEKVEKLVEEVSFEPKIQSTQLKELKNYFQSEYKRFSDREALFTRAELRKLESAAARDRVAGIINQEMEGHQFPFFIIILLQGEWLDFIQLVLLKKGLQSKEWQAALKLTRMLIWSLKDRAQDNANERTRLRNIIANLPSRARALDKLVDVKKFIAENAIADIEAEYEAIQKGEPSERGEFTPIEIQGFASGKDSESSMSEKSKLEAAPGEWFYYEELDHESSRLKLILLWQNKQLLFSNHNCKSAIAIGYADFCRSLAAGRIRRLPPAPACNTIVRNYVEQLRKDQRQKQAEAKRRKKEEQEALRKQAEMAKKLVAASDIGRPKLSLAERKAALIKEIEAVRKVETARKQKAEKKKQAAEKILTDASDAIRRLGIGAEIKLTTKTDAVIECKLLTKMSSIDRYIFVDRDGIKVAQHNQEELVKLYLDKNLEILTKGEEFEDTLAAIVQGLREDRDKILAEEEA